MTPTAPAQFLIDVYWQVIVVRFVTVKTSLIFYFFYCYQFLLLNSVEHQKLMLIILHVIPF